MQLASKILHPLPLTIIGMAGAIALASLLPIDLIQRADCTLGYMCGLYRQSMIIAAVYGISANPLHRMSFALMLMVYYVTLIVFSKNLIHGIEMVKK